MRKSLPINPDGSIIVPKDIVEEVFGKAREAVVHVRTHSLTLSPIYVDLNSGELPKVLSFYFEDERLEKILGRFERSSEEGVQFEGDLSVLSLSDVLLFLSASKKYGCLLIDADSPWGIFFNDGHLVMVAGEDYRFGLAARLLKRQFVTEQDLVEGMRKYGGGDKSDLLFEISGLTDEEYAKEEVQAVEEMLYHLFEFSKGRFSFHNGALKHATVTLPLSATNYVMEATRRLDEYSRIQAQFPLADTLLDLCEDVTASTKLSFEEEAVLSQVNGMRTVEEVIIRSKLSEIDAKKGIVSLLAAGLIRQRKSREEEKSASQIVLDEEEKERYSGKIDSYNAVFANIYMALQVEAGARTEVILSPFFKGLEKESSILYGLSLEEDGSLDPKKVLSNLSKFPKEQREDILVRDLNELLYFQLFAVKNSLGPELEAGIVEMAKSLLSPS
ncbi:MAG TPA: DUF4388 domain-containing protein [Acidobacteriota bacterium]|nr:DUF4388 domain-containing protein [Acidobacteriota bacterium]HQO19174.1 DUF4388 domain-containing protein [Acidobacteriota bacterium]HQQ46445.1 DUF4388 domain-containing protein [Acidobacteriota bacterium]